MGPHGLEIIGQTGGSDSWSLRETVSPWSQIAEIKGSVGGKAKDFINLCPPKPADGRAPSQAAYKNPGDAMSPWPDMQMTDQQHVHRQVDTAPRGIRGSTLGDTLLSQRQCMRRLPAMK
jgi:hypothetical protein